MYPPNLCNESALVFLTVAGFGKGLPEQWSRLLQSSAITREDYAKNPVAVIEALEFYTDHQKQQHYEELGIKPAGSSSNQQTETKPPAEQPRPRPPRPAAPPALEGLVAKPSDLVPSTVISEHYPPPIPPHEPIEQAPAVVVYKDTSTTRDLPDVPTEVVLTTKERLPSGEIVERRSVITHAHAPNPKPKPLADAEAALEKPYQPPDVRYSKMSGDQLMEQLRALATKGDPNKSYTLVKKIGQG